MATATRDDSMDRPDGRRVSWCEFGDPRGWPLVYCHGMPGSRLEGALFARAAALRGIRLIAPDRPGYGGTSPFPERALGEEVEDLKALVDTLGLRRFDVLGFSGGGPHAMACAVRHSDQVRRAGLVSSLAPFDRVDKAGMGDGLRQLWELAETDFPSFEAAFEEALAEAGDAYGLLLGGAPQADRAILQSEGVAAPYRQGLAEGMRQGMAGMLADARALASPWLFDSAAVGQPTDIWHGSSDGNAPIGMARWLARVLPAARLTEWSEATHYELFRRQDEVLDTFTGN